MLDRTASLIRYGRATVYEILDDLCSDSRFSELSFIYSAREGCKLGGAFRDRWEEAAAGLKETFLQEEDIELIRKIGRNLGGSDAEGQLSAIALEKEEQKTLLDAASSVWEKKSRLYRSLGFLAGAFIAIILI
jgi:stage III sporulation protein AB